jgi:hypothetical protein
MVGYRDPDDVGANSLDPLDLLDGGGHVRGLGVGHGLHRDGASPPTGTLPTMICRICDERWVIRERTWRTDYSCGSEKRAVRPLL